MGGLQRGNYQGIREVLEIHAFISLQRVERGHNALLEVIEWMGEGLLFGRMWVPPNHCFTSELNNLQNLVFGDEGFFLLNNRGGVLLPNMPLTPAVSQEAESIEEVTN